MKTLFLDKIYQRVDFDRELVFKFFTVFSLFEYALKNTQYKRVSGEKLEADWMRFARDIQNNFDPGKNADLAASVDYMMTRPVKRQVIRNGYLDFATTERRPDISDIEWLSVLIRCVRNNLFHGGKFRYERPRDPELIQHSLIILEEWAQCHPDVKRELEYVH